MNVKAHAAIPKYVVEAKEEFVSDKKMRKKQTGSFLFRGARMLMDSFSICGNNCGFDSSDAAGEKYYF